MLSPMDGEIERICGADGDPGHGGGASVEQVCSTPEINPFADEMARDNYDHSN